MHLPLLYSETVLLIAALIVALWAGIVLAGAVSRLLIRQSLRRRFKRGAKGEAQAEMHLRSHGFTSISKQVEQTARMLIDGEKHEYGLRADLFAVKRGKRCIVEAKTGEKAVDPRCADTRRQLLEYAVMYNADRVFLFDAEDRSLREIQFPALRERQPGNWCFLCAGLIAGVFLTGFIAVICK